MENKVIVLWEMDDFGESTVLDTCYEAIKFMRQMKIIGASNIKAYIVHECSSLKIVEGNSLRSIN